MHEIERVIRGYAAGARRCKEGKLDGVEIIAWGHLVDQFLSPVLNRRDDQYGGSIENRCRFALEVVQAVREAVGPDFVVGIRITGDEHVPDGRTPEECIEIARILAASGHLDFFNVIGGSLGTDAALAYTLPTMGRRYGEFLGLAAAIRQATGLPVFQASRIPDLSTARHALEQGMVDMVGMTRAHMADPHIVAKLTRGDEHRIRPCVGMGYCIDRIYQGKDALCIHNPATGREATMPHAVPPSNGEWRKVVVVGGGPAGMEAARVAKLRGHEVVLLEATDRLGGQINLASKAPGREEIQGIAGWLQGEIELLGVDVRTNQYAEVDDVLAMEPDVVIVATGGTPNTEFMKAGSDLVSSVWDVLGGYVEPSGTVLLYDDHGWHQASSTAVALAKKGCKVEMVTPDRMVAFEVGATNYPAYLREMYRAGVKLTPDLELTSVRRAGNRLLATFWNEYAESEVEIEADHVVVEHGTLPADELYHALKAGSTNGGEIDIDGLAAGEAKELRRIPEGRYLLYRVGDAVSSRNIHAAIYDSLRLCKSL